MGGISFRDAETQRELRTIRTQRRKVFAEGAKVVMIGLCYLANGIFDFKAPRVL